MVKREAGILLRHVLGRNEDDQVKPEPVSKPGFEHKHEAGPPPTLPRGLDDTTTTVWGGELIYTDTHLEDNECNVLHSIGDVNLDNRAM